MFKSAIRALALVGALSVPALAATPKAAPLDTVVFGGGCFWGVQAVFQHVTGVITATSGYAGGHTKKPTYEAITTGNTGHAEVVRVVFDPAKVSYNTLMEVFFSVIHDPTQLNYQGPDHGTQYRSAIFYTDAEQKAATDAFIAKLTQAKAFRKPIVTQVAALKEFHVAEKYHQDYATLNPNQPYIRIHDAPKIAALKAEFPKLWSDKLAGH